MAEIQAIPRACDLCLSRPEVEGKNIEIVSHSKTAVSWINGSGVGNIKFAQLIYDIRNNLSLLGHAKVVFGSRASNSFADMLAKNGSRNGGDLLIWSF